MPVVGVAVVGVVPVLTLLPPGMKEMCISVVIYMLSLQYISSDCHVH